MAWVYVDDQFPDHPKVVAAGEAAAYLYVCGLAYCKRYGTEGRIPKAQVAKLVTAKASALTHRLLAVGLWEDNGDEYAVHDYAEWNKPQESRSAAGRKAAKARWDRVADADAMRTHSESHVSGDAKGDASGCPPPHPFPSGFTSSPSSTSSIDPADDDVLEQALVVYVDRKLALTRSTIEKVGPWKRKVLANARAELAPQARDWLTRYVVTPNQLADALVAGGVPPSWNNCRRPA